jgi:hypothetical protein
MGKNLYNINYYALRKELKKTTEGGKASHICIGRIYIMKMAILPKLSRDSMQCSLKFQCYSLQK